MVDLSALEALPSSGPGSKAYKFTTEEDAALLKYWPTKCHADVAKVLGMATNTCLRRYRELTSQ